MKTPIFTIESYFFHGNTYYFDLLKDLTFGIHFNEKLIFNHKDPSECIVNLKSRGIEADKYYLQY